MRTYRIWLWPHLLSLDAPLVAVAWQALLGRSIVPVPGVQTAILGLSVWLIYVFDRILDGLAPPLPTDSPRHRFARRFRTPLLCAVFLAGAADLILAFKFLEAPRLERGLFLLILVGAHFFLTHRDSRPWPKELWIAFIFAAGVWLPVLAADPSLVSLGQALLFCALCWWNCAAIESWEQHQTKQNWHASTIWLISRLPAAALVIAAAAAALYIAHPHPVAAAEALAAMLYWGLQRRSPELSADVLRLAVDLILLVPFLFP